MAGRLRRCSYCDAPLPTHLGPAARYCCRAHRQRAYEAGRAADVDALHKQVRKLQRQVAVYERIVEDIGADPRCAKHVEDVLARHISALRRANAAAGGS